MIFTVFGVIACLLLIALFLSGDGNNFTNHRPPDGFGW